ncbi:beta-galactosidase [Colwellia sp. 1_MG-2023]|uniref:alpha-amylase family protein n=1 Tax=Colwellia sp. 1_MG-2023 TaxID=3062649 RepID=UPI0026E3D77C|nr:alpha-amylase family protein [Colwellia sp. 1_MG-2023]MDO6444160.1 beta-galactosidase [Colwellia sp. 1_MG-2023]
MNIKKLILSMLFGALVISPSLYAGVYKGATDDATFLQLLEEATTKSELLADKISEAKALGLTTDYAQVSQTTIRLFKDVFAPWDKKNPDKVREMYDAKYFSQYDPVGAKGLPFDELADSIEVADAAITQLQEQIDGVVLLTPPPNFKTGKLRLKGPNYELDGNAVIAGKFFWQPNESDILEAYGYGGEGYYSVQDLNTETTLKSWRQNNLLTKLKEQNVNNRSPIQFFLGHIVPTTYWLRESYPEAFTIGSRLFTDYDIDNPNVKFWLNTLFDKQLSVAVEQLGNTERVHMIANEPTFSIRENGVDADRGVSNYTLDKYVSWLEKKYQTIEHLNNIYSSDFNQFSDLKTTYTIPLSLSYQGGPVWYDWNRFNMDRVNEWFTYLHNAVHKSDPNAKTHIKIMGERSIHTSYHDEGLDFEFIAKLVDMPGADNQSSSLAADWDVRHEMSWQQRYSLEWRAQTMMLDFNKSIAPEKHFYDSEWHGLSGARWRDFHMSPEYVRSTLWIAATHGLGSLTSWVWNRKEDGSIDPRADFIGTSVTQPIQLDAYGRTLKELNAHGNKISSLVPVKRNYLIYYNKDSAIQDPEYTDKMSDIYEALKLLNIPTGFTTPAELAKVDFQNQVIVIPPTMYISDQDLTGLEAFVDSGGNTILFNKSTSFVKTELGKTRNSTSSFTAMSTLEVTDVLLMAKQLEETLLDVTAEQAITLEISDENREKSYGILSAQYDDENANKTIVSLVNVSQENITVKLKSKLGIPSDITDVITQNKLSAEITMKPMDVRLISIGRSVEESIDITPEVNPEPPQIEIDETSSGGSLFFELFILISFIIKRKITITLKAIYEH